MQIAEPLISRLSPQHMKNQEILFKICRYTHKQPCNDDVDDSDNLHDKLSYFHHPPSLTGILDKLLHLLSPKINCDLNVLLLPTDLATLRAIYSLQIVLVVCSVFSLIKLQHVYDIFETKFPPK